ncbi:hypothetical protein L1887_27029 [Cichorium endivia]|nr:hypothetical protein L1887_27029 [Cichorium endivia]
MRNRRRHKLRRAIKGSSIHGSIQTMVMTTRVRLEQYLDLVEDDEGVRVRLGMMLKTMTALAIVRSGMRLKTMGVSAFVIHLR